MALPAHDDERGDVPGPSGGALERSAAEQLARTLRAIAHPTRLQLLSIIFASAEGRSTVSELTEPLGLSQPTISHHLKIMTEDGLLDREQRGRNVWYSIALDRVEAISDLLR